MKFLLAIAAVLLLSSLVFAQDTTPTNLASPTETPDPEPYAALEQYTIEAMRAREYPGGQIALMRTLQITDTYTRYFIEYPSDDLTITGILQMPQGEGPFPVIILNHGYIRQPDYWSGYETWEAAGYLNARGYMTVAPDFRSWGLSDWDVSLFHGGLTVDVLNLISALGTIPQADTERIGMWGHSMGGGIAMKALVIDPRIDAVVLYATNSADDADLIAHYGPGCLYGIRAGRRCNRGEVIPAEIDETLFETYLDAAADSEFLKRVSAIRYLSGVTSPVQIHIGTRDTVVDDIWSTKLFNTLNNVGIGAEFYWYENQDHTFWGESWLTFMQRVTRFFDEHVKNGG